MRRFAAEEETGTTAVRDDTDETFRGLDPNLIYTCTIDIDP